MLHNFRHKESWSYCWAIGSMVRIWDSLWPGHSIHWLPPKTQFWLFGAFYRRNKWQTRKSGNSTCWLDKQSYSTSSNTCNPLSSCPFVQRQAQLVLLLIAYRFDFPVTTGALFVAFMLNKLLSPSLLTFF